MKLSSLLAALSLGALALCYGLPEATAQSTTATVAFVNNSTWAIDCRVYWGSTVKSFNNIAPSTASPAQNIVVSNTERNATCKKRGATTVSPTIKSSTSEGGDYKITCSHTSADQGLVCTASKATAE